MTTRKDITSAAGVPVPLAERRALDVLAAAGLIPPLPKAGSRSGSGESRDGALIAA